MKDDKSKIKAKGEPGDGGVRMGESIPTRLTLYFPASRGNRGLISILVSDKWRAPQDVSGFVTRHTGSLFPLPPMRAIPVKIREQSTGRTNGGH